MTAPLMVLAVGCGDDGSAVSDGSPLTDDQRATSADWIVTLFKGSSETGPGTFRGGEVAVSPAAVSDGLADIESTYMEDLIGMNGGSFRGNCFMERNDDGTYKQRVVCGPYENGSGDVNWMLVPISVRFDTDQNATGFEHAPAITPLRGMVPELLPELRDRLVRPDRKQPDAE